MEDSYFVLKHYKPLKEGQRPFAIPGLKDGQGNDIGMLQPTSVSAENGHLEWLIPNTALNQNHISKFYSNMNVLLAGQETKTYENVKPMAGMPKPMGSHSIKKLIKEPKEPDTVEMETVKVAPKKPVRKNMLKSLQEKLTAQGIDYPQGATLKQLKSIEKAIKSADPAPALAPAIDWDTP